MLENFRFSLFRFYLTAQQNVTLPAHEHIGALLRDRFGSALRYVVCPLPWGQRCADCIMQSQCTYIKLFETTSEAVNAGNVKGRDVYRPFVLEPPLNGKRDYAPGESLTLNLVLIGEGIDYLPCFIAAFEEMGRHGLGVSPVQWQVERVTNLDQSSAPDGTLIFDGMRKKFVGRPQTKSFATVAAESKQLSDKFITMDLITPLGVEEAKELVYAINTSILTRALLRRISRLAQMWCGEALELDFRGLIDRWDQNITCEVEDLRREDWQRHSIQKGPHTLRGLRGRLILRGKLRSLHPFLKLGEYLHIGKQTVFGLGKYECR